MSRSSRSLNLPPADRAFWQAPAGSAGPLLYLAWGTRDFGVAPIAPSQHDGWVYAIVGAGHPTLVRASARERIAPKTLLVLGPDCDFGWEDDPRKSSRLSVWMWRSRRHPDLLGLAPNFFGRWSLRPEDSTRFATLHDLTRHEVFQRDDHSDRALGGLQDMLEARIARLLAPARPPSPTETVARAVRWLEQHMNTRQPLARLADYLGVSPSTVQRMFRGHLRRSVVDVLGEIRVREAEKLLRESDISVKALAYRLGYRHPHDFSRAFRRLRGRSPSAIGRRDP